MKKCVSLLKKQRRGGERRKSDGERKTAVCLCTYSKLCEISMVKKFKKYSAYSIMVLTIIPYDT